MRFKMTTAQFMAVGNGNTPVPLPGLLPLQRATRFDQADDLATRLNDLAAEWFFDSDLPDGDDAKAQTPNDVSAALGDGFRVMTDQSGYRTIFDTNNKPIGHDFNAFVQFNNEPFIAVEADGTVSFGCVFISIRKETVA